MKLKLLLALFLVQFQFAFSQWIDIGTGINDKLTGGVFLQNNGMVSGEHGLYYTTNGGVGASSWTRFQITGNTADSIIYENTAFSHCFSNPNNSASSGTIFACGKDQLTQRAIVMKVSFPALTYEILYVGDVGSKLNRIGWDSNSSRYYAVGDAGLIVRFSSFSSSTTETIVSSDNLNSIVFHQGGCMVGTFGKILLITNLNTYEFQEITTPMSTNKDMASDYLTTYGVGNNYALSNNSGTIVRTEYTNFDYGPLNANAVWKHLSNVFVGTDHGVFMSLGDGTVLGWQPSSMNYTINALWSQSSSTSLYAFGNNGLVLKTTNYGGATQPFAKINSVGACINTSVPLIAKIGGASNYKWYVDGVLFSTAINPGSYTFNTAGIHEIKLIVANGVPLETTIIKNILIADLPQINKPVSISNNMLCHSETIQIQIDNSEPNVVYTLKKTSNSNSYGTSQPGTGGTIYFTSSQLSESGNYYLEAKNPAAPCTSNFTNLNAITVEQTKADFHADLINVLPNETVNLYSKAVEAQHFQWDFSSNGPLMNSTLENPTVAFSAAGPTTITMDASSDHGCHSVMAKQGYVYQAPSNPDNCWTMVNTAPDPAWNGLFYDGISKITPTSDGFLSCGGFKDGIIDSKIGINKSIPGSGTYLAKHDKNGTLKWFVYVKHVPVFNDFRGRMLSTVVDQQGNIYICGTDAGEFTDNRGEVYDLDMASSYSEEICYIIKLDSNGKFLWKLNSLSGGFLPSKLYIDRENNLVVTGCIGSDVQTTHQVFFNNQPSFVITQNVVSTNGAWGGRSLVKISPSGALIWNVGITISNTNGADLTDIGFDSNNNIYITGINEYSADFYSVGNPTPVTMNGFGDYGNTMFLVKYNPNGIFQWKTRSNVVGSFFNNTTVKSMFTDDDGTCYITGTNTRSVEASNQIFENTDGTITQNTIGGFFVLKVNSNGVCQWIEGDASAKYSQGSKIIKVNDQLHIVGEVDSANSITEPTVFKGADLVSYDLVMNHNDIFMVTYDTNGNLIRVITSGETLEENNSHQEISGFFKGDGNAFYLSRNFGEIINYNFFGDDIVSNEVDGMITKFSPDCGLLKYQRALSVNDYGKIVGVNLFPNPTNGTFTIDLGGHTLEVLVTIYDLLGKKIDEIQAANVKQLTSTIKGDKGVYVLKVKTKEQTAFFKLIVN